MRRWLVRSLKVLLVLAALWAIDRYVHCEEIAAAATLHFEGELQALIFPSLELREASLEEALAYLRTEARKAGWRGDLRFVVRSEAEARKRFHPSLPSKPTQTELSERAVGSVTGTFQTTPLPEDSQPESVPGVAAAPVSEPLPDNANVPTVVKPDLVTLALTNIPLTEACKYVAYLANYEMLIGNRVVEFFPELRDGTCKPFVKRTFTHFPLRRLSTTNTPGLPNGHLDARDFLRSVGVSFYEGTSAEYDPAPQTLTVVNTAENADLVDTLISDRYEPTTLERVKFWLQSLFYRFAE